MFFSKEGKERRNNKNKIKNTQLNVEIFLTSNNVRVVARLYYNIDIYTVLYTSTFYTGTQQPREGCVVEGIDSEGGDAGGRSVGRKN